MTSQAAVLVSFLIYLAFFGWLGWSRGVRREFIVTLVAALFWVLLQERGELFVSIANLGAAAFRFLLASGLGGGQADADASAATLITADGQDAFLFVSWAAIFVLTYIWTNLRIPDRQSTRNGWAIALGMLNGLFFAVAFLPSMVALFAPDGTLPQPGEDLGLLNILGSGVQLIWNSLASLWSLVEPLGNLAILVLFTLILVLAATTIRGGAKAKS